jgi:hypothetical protein
LVLIFAVAAANAKASGAIAFEDMQPLQEMAAEQLKLTAIMERIAVSLEKMLAISQERAEDAEIVRRAEIMAQEMLKQLQVTKPAPRRRRT